MRFLLALFTKLNPGVKYMLRQVFSHIDFNLGDCLSIKSGKIELMLAHISSCLSAFEDGE